MGVPRGESNSEHAVELVCRNCGTEYETDETMANDCPECGFQDFEVRD